MLTLLICSSGFFALFGIVYPICAIIALRIMGDRRPIRELLREI